MTYAREVSGDADGTPRVYLAVPFAEKDAAKALGARWDPAKRCWYVQASTHPALRRWPRTGDLPDPLPGEDRGFGAGLFVDLVPQTCWFTNARSALTPVDWERVRLLVLGRTARHCEGCGSSEGRMEVHERWDFDASTLTQRLCRLVCLCERCHSATHFGLAELKGTAPQARAQLAAVNGWTPRQVEQHIADAITRWSERSKVTWALDLSILQEAGIAAVIPTTQARAQEAREQTVAARRHNP